MVRLHILVLTALPICLAQFSIQGPSDGNRAAQGLTYSEEKGIEYSDQRDSLGTGDFSIQGASDGNSDFTIQGASDGNSNFKIQGATDGNNNFQIQGATDGNSNFHIQGATDGNANYQSQGATDGNHQSTIQSPYDANQGGQRSLQYDDPNGFKLNWRSYAHDQLSPQPQQQPQPQPTYATSQAQYSEPAPQPQQTYATSQAQYSEPAPRPVARPAPQPVHQSGEEEPEPVQQPINYRPFENVPAQIKQLLQFQLQIPYLNAIPEHFRYDQLATAQPPAQADHGQAHNQQEAPQRSPAPQHRQKPRGHQRAKRQAHQQQQQRQQQPQQQYRKIPQPTAKTLPQYSTNVPSQIMQILQFQSQIPYLNAIPEKFRYNLDTPPAPAEPYQSGVPAPQNAPRGHERAKRQAHQQPQQPQHPQQQYKRIPQPAPEAQPHYSSNVPSQIKQLLQFQSQIPYVSAIPEKFRYNLENAQHAPQNEAQRGKREAQQPEKQYRRIQQPAVETQPQYSTHLPSDIEQILKYQAQAPYNIIANQIVYRPDKPYVPQPVTPPAATNYETAPYYQGQNNVKVRPVTEHNK